MRIFAFAASLRRGSYNRTLIERASELARAGGAEVNLVDFWRFDMPMYDANLNEEKGLPPGAEAMRGYVDDHDAIMIAAPEYNYSISGALKNAIDWVSRARPMPWRGKSIYLMSASPSAVGGIRGLWHTRVPLEGCGALVFPDMFTVANAHQAFDESGRLKDEAAAERLSRDVLGFVRMAEALVPVCTKAPPEQRERQKTIVAALEHETQVQSR
jgi:chromate reductase, NAD(P)H dehydrogenase (quinone)